MLKRIRSYLLYWFEGRWMNAPLGTRRSAWLDRVCERLDPRSDDPAYDPPGWS